MEKNKQLISLGLDILKNNVPKVFAADGSPMNLTRIDMENKLREEFAELAGYSNGKVNKHVWNRNKETIFEIMEEMIDEIFPREVIASMGRFANVKTFDDGDKPRFIIKKGKKNVRRFVTKVATAGVYDRVRLSKDYVDMDMEALGGAIFIPFTDFVRSEYTLEELLRIFLDELMSAIYEEVQKALIATFTVMPAANKHTAAAFDDTEMKRIINNVKAYGEPTIFCTQEFANTITPTADFISEKDKEMLADQGFVGRYSGANIIVLPQSFDDVFNVNKVLDQQYAYIVPAGSEDKIVNLGFEGQTHIKDSDREDWSMEMQIFKKYGITVLHTNFFGIYRNTAL